MFGNDPDVDVNIIAPPIGAQHTSSMIVSGGGGSDFISGRGGPSSFPPAATVKLVLDGDAGDDTLVDGLAPSTGGPFASFAADTLRGGPGNDTLFSVDGIHDGVQGNDGFDKATIDNRDVLVNSRGNVDVEQFTIASVRRLRLDPAAVHAQASACGSTFRPPTSAGARSSSRPPEQSRSADSPRPWSAACLALRSRLT